MKLEQLLDTKYLKVYNNDGWVYASRKPLEQQCTGFRDISKAVARAFPDAVCIWGRHTQTGLIPVVRQFRKSINDYIWELPAGLIDEGESIVEAATRELKEETGLDIVHTGPYLSCFPSIGITDECQAVIKCAVSGELSTDGLQDHEELTVEMWGPEDFDRHFGEHIDGRLAMIWLATMQGEELT